MEQGRALRSPFSLFPPGLNIRIHHVCIVDQHISLDAKSIHQFRETMNSASQSSILVLIAAQFMDQFVDSLGYYSLIIATLVTYNRLHHSTNFL